jgi:hypothetical protein
MYFQKRLLLKSASNGGIMSGKAILLSVILILVTGCSSSPGASPFPSTATPTAEMAPADVAVSQITFTPEVPIPTPEGDSNECDNPFYPVTDEATWTYSISNGQNAIHTMSADDFGKFTINVQSSDISAAIEGQCTNEGIILMEVPGATTAVLSQDGSSTVSAVNVSGVTLPNDLGQGEQWSQIIDVTTQIGKSTIQTDYMALGFENISVPAGNFYSLKVEQSGYVTIHGQKVSMHGYQWLAEGVGVVKSAMDGAPSLELVSYDIPE